jgi:hypothetical protein
LRPDQVRRKKRALWVTREDGAGPKSFNDAIRADEDQIAILEQVPLRFVLAERSELDVGRIDTPRAKLSENPGNDFIQN